MPAVAASDSASSIDRAIDVLFDLHAAGGARGVSELGRDLAMPKSSAHRLLASLARRGLLEQDELGRYRPGLALLALGLGVLDREPLAAAARAVLERESEATGETAFLTITRGGRIVVLDKVEGRSFLRVAPSIGSEVPVHATAAGKLTLALAAESVALGPPPWPEFTAGTPADAVTLEREVDEARRQGWAANRDQWIEGLTVVAAPVLVRERFFGCFVIAAPTPRVDTCRLRELAERAVAAAADISARLCLEETAS